MNVLLVWAAMNYLKVILFFFCPSSRRVPVSFVSWAHRQLCKGYVKGALNLWFFLLVKEQCDVIHCQNSSHDESLD